MRIWIDLPDVPDELTEPARNDDDPNVKLRRREALFRYFGASLETKAQAEILVFSLAAAMFRAFREPVTRPSKPPGRPQAFRPKYEAHFLAEVAQAYDEYRAGLNSQSATSPARVYRDFLAHNPSLADQLRVTGKDLKRGSFEKLLNVGRSANNTTTVWYKGPSPKSRKTSGEYRAIDKIGHGVALNPVVAGVLEGLRHVEIGPWHQCHFNEHTIEALFWLNPESEADQNTINAMYDTVESALEAQERSGVKSRLQKKSSTSLDPLWLMKKNGKFNI